MGLFDRLGDWDDKSLLYDAQTGESAPFRKYAKAWIASKIVTVAAILGLGALFGPAVAFGSLLIVFVILLFVCIVWRRRRNKRLTGSPWTRPRSA